MGEPEGSLYQLSGVSVITAVLLSCARATDHAHDSSLDELGQEVNY